MSESETKGITLFRTDASMMKTKVSAEELKYRETEYSSEQQLLKKQRIDCTVCNRNLKDRIVSGRSISVHPALEVILCDKCGDFYGDGNFSVDEDGSDKYCRWCGNGGNLYCCSHCSVAICSKCVKRNLTKSYIPLIEDDDWRCFICETKPIWPHRAICWAANKFIENYEKRKTKRSKIEVLSSDSDEVDDPGVRRSKRTKKVSSSEEDEPEKGNKAKRTKKAAISEEDKPKKENQARNTNKRSRISSSEDNASQKSEPVRSRDAKPSKRGATVTSSDEKAKPKKVQSRSSTDLSPAISPARKQVKFMEHVVTDTLNDYDKLIKIMVKSKAKYMDKYVKNKRFMKSVESSSVLKDNLLQLLRDSKESIECLERNFISNLRCFDLVPEGKSENESAGDERMDVDPGDSVCSNDKTVPVNASNLTEVADECRDSQATEKNASAGEDSAGEDVGDAATDERTAAQMKSPVLSGAETEGVLASSDNEVNESRVNGTSTATSDEESNVLDTSVPSEKVDTTANSLDVSENATSPPKSSLEASRNGAASEDGSVGENVKDVAASQEESMSEKSQDVAAPQDTSMCETSRDAIVSEFEDDVAVTETAADSKKESAAAKVDQSVDKDKLAKVAMLQFSSDESSSPEKEESKSSEADMSGIGPLKPDAEETKLKKKRKRRERDEAKKSFLRDSSSSDDENRDIDRLTNLRNLCRRKKAALSEEEKTASEDDHVSEDGKVVSSEKEKKKRSSIPEKNESWALEFVCSGSGSDDDNSKEEASFSEFNNTLSRKQKDFSLNKDEISKKILLESTESEDKSQSEDDVFMNTQDTTKKKKAEKAEKPVNGKKCSSDETVAAEEDDDSDDVNKKVKAKWKQDKLLKGKLSETDTSDEERIIARALKKEAKEKEKAKQNGCDSSEDSEDIFRPKEKFVAVQKKKRKLLLSSSESEAEVEELHSSSVEVISDESDEPKKKAKKRKRVKNNMDSDESEDEEPNASQTPGSASKGRKNIRKVLKDEELAEQTRRTAEEEEARKKRIAERQALFNKSFQVKDTSDQTLSKLVLDFDEKTNEELVTVHPLLLKKLKPHQAEGVKFMWDSCFESLKQIEKGVGGGCILAHCMGLGKTLQVITLIHTLLTHETTKVKTVLVICPLSTVLNWVSEFKMWLKPIPDYEDINIHELTKARNLINRAHSLKRWSKEGGVMVIGYDMFRTLVQGKNAREKCKKQIHEALLDPGPDLVICDEGHMLKNEKTAISKATMQIKSLRRIVLTGTPLQNNLIEYHCMMQFVKPNLLGEKKEFQNRFVNPITNGQYVDSTTRDVKLMKRRAHVLHKMLDGVVQRFDYKVLTPFLPPKHEFVISVALSDLQAKLYEYYIKNKSLTVAAGSTTLFKDYQIMRLIWTHPLAMKLNHDRKMKIMEKYDDDDDDNDSAGSMKDFVVSGSDDESSSKSSNSDSDKSVISLSSDGGKSKKNGKPKGRLTRAQRKDMGVEVDDMEKALEYEPVNDWWHQFVDSSDMEDYKQGPKLILLFAILRQCELIGDKVLVFSQSIPSLDMIEYFLQRTNEFSQRVSAEDSLAPEEDQADYIGTWNKDEDYFRLDGQTPNEQRAYYCNRFNRPDNLRARLFLISTKAGGLGINLTAANRVIIFDASWNPSYDIQSIFRVYRFGQNKPCYIYRFLSQGTMEEKIYERQVTKLSVSCRVVDEQQIDRHFTRNEVTELYNFNRKMPSPDEIPKLPSDRLMAELLKEYRDVILSYHEHDSLLENVMDEDLTEEEKKAAWNDYEMEKNRPAYQPPPPRVDEFARNIDNQAIMNALRNEHPTANTQQLMTMFNMVRSKLEKYYQEQMIMKQAQQMINLQQMNVQPNPPAASQKDVQDQLQLRKAAFMHQLQAQAAAKQQPDMMNPGFDWNGQLTPQKLDQPSTSNGYQQTMATYSSPTKMPHPLRSPFSTPKKMPSSSASSPYATPQKVNGLFSPMKDASPDAAALERDPLKTPSTWTFQWDEPDRKNLKDLKTLLAEVSNWWSPKFQTIGDNVLMHLPFCVRRETLERKLNRFLPLIRFNRVQPDISERDALDVIIKTLRLPNLD